MTVTDQPTAPDTPSAPLVYPVDPEHASLRFALLITFFALAAIGYGLVAAFVPQSGFNIIALVGGFVLAALVIQVVDRGLKARWPSGRTVEISDEGVRLALRGVTQRQITPDEPVNVVQWRFTITKRARAPKGWYVVALALQQDDLYLPVYTFMPPAEFEQFEGNAAYEPLTSMKQPTDMRLAGQERRLRNAESARWYEGAEMTKDHFAAYVAALKARYPQWMTKKASG